MVTRKHCLITFIFLFLFLISFASAQEIRFTGEQNSIVPVTETCIHNNLPCSSAFVCNITIEDPSQNILINNKVMTRNDTLYNYTLNEDQTLVLGIYRVDPVFCTDGTSNGSSSFFFRITNSGAQPIETGEGFGLIGVIIILLVGVIFFLIMGILIANKPFKIFLISLALLFMVGTVGFGVTIIQQMFGAFEAISTAYGGFFRLLVILLSAGGIGLIVWLTVVALKSFDSTRSFFKRSYDEEDD